MFVDLQAHTIFLKYKWSWPSVWLTDILLLTVSWGLHEALKTQMVESTVLSSKQVISGNANDNWD